MKQTRLDDNASIYNHKDTRSKKEVWNSLTTKEKFQFFKDYYLKYTILALIILAFAIQFIISIVTKKDTVFSISLINQNIEEATITQLSEELTSSLLLDSKKEQVTIDQSLYSDDPDGATLAEASQQKLMVYVYSGEYDIMIAERAMIENFAASGFFIDLNLFLPESQKQALNDQFLLCKGGEPSSPESSDTGAYGVSLTGNTALSAYTKGLKEPVLAVFVSSKQTEHTLRFFEEYLAK